jgi:tetratricopeptide (TPR) repeat protein
MSGPIAGGAQPEKEQPPLLSASRTVIVVTDQAEAFAGNESVGKIPPGSVLKYSKENGQWLLIPRYRGWLDREHVVAIERAVAFFDAIVAKTPTAQAHHHRGIAYAQLGQMEPARRDFEQAIQLGLKEPGVYINRGAVLQRGGKIAEAIADYTRAIELDPNSARAYDNRSSARAALGQLDESLADSDAAIRIDPAFAEAYNNRGVTRRMKGDYAAAIEDYSQAIELFPDYAAAFANRGYARKQLREFGATIEDYEKALRIEPDSPGAGNDLAWLLATCGDAQFRDPPRAVELATRACDLTQHQSADLLDTLAAAHAAAGDFDAAVSRAEQALARAGANPPPALAERLALYRTRQAYREE